MDYLIFTFIITILFSVLELWMWHSRKSAAITKAEKDAAMGFIPVLMILLNIILLATGGYFAGNVKQEANNRLENIVKGIAPTLAYELGSQGHSRVRLDTAADDRHYLRLIGTMVKWMKLNPEIQSIYTMRQKDNGSIVFVLGPETDYDRNGVIQGEDEQRVPIGEAYTESVPEIRKAFKGIETMQPEPTKDKWGYSISAFVPVYDEHGKQEAVLGVDFDGTAWLHGIRAARLNVMGVLLILILLLNTSYLIVFRYRMEAIRAQRHRLELAASKEAAERASRAKSDFLARMSHDLRTPLNAISGFAQLLKYDNTLSGQQRFMVGEIHGAGDHLTGLINEILDLSKIEAGKISLTFEFVPVKATILRACGLIEQSAAERKIRIIKNPDVCEDYFVYADTTRLMEVLLNLLSNAVKYNRESGSITVSCELIADGYIRIIVEDTGEGLRQQELQSIFEPFTRLDDHRAIEGTGIGLTVTKQIIEHMGGKIGVASKPGLGSSFWIDLPCVRGKHDATVLNGEAADATENSGRHYNVLYVEDTPANVHLMSNVLSHIPSISMTAVSSGEEALEYIAKELPDLVLLDINLPGISGFEVMNRLKSGGQSKTVPVIAVSSNSGVEYMTKARDAGFTAYIMKPIDIENFLRVVAGALSENA